MSLGQALANYSPLPGKQKEESLENNIVVPILHWLFLCSKETEKVYPELDVFLLSCNIPLLTLAIIRASAIKINWKEIVIILRIHMFFPIPVSPGTRRVACAQSQKAAWIRNNRVLFHNTYLLALHLKFAFSFFFFNHQEAKQGLYSLSMNFHCRCKWRRPREVVCLFVQGPEISLLRTDGEKQLFRSIIQTHSCNVRVSFTSWQNRENWK